MCTSKTCFYNALVNCENLGEICKSCVIGTQINDYYCCEILHFLMTIQYSYQRVTVYKSFVNYKKTEKKLQRFCKCRYT